MDVMFRNELGRALAGTLELPKDVTRPAVVVFAHGFGSGRGSSRNRAIAEQLLGRGVAAFLLDFTGHGDSEGSIEEATIGRMVRDLRAAVDLVAARSDVDGERSGVSGSSSGGIVALRFAAEDARVTALVLRSVPAEGLFEDAARVRAPTLVIAGELDIPIVEEDRALADAMTVEHRFEVVAGAGHLYEGPGQAEQVAALSTNWFVEKLRANASS